MSSRSLNPRKTRTDLPPRGETVQVRHDGSIRVAFRDWDGVWRDFFSRKELAGDITVLEAGARTPGRGRLDRRRAARS